MSSLYGAETRSPKRGNGIIYMRHQERQALKNNLKHIKGQFNGETLVNLNYMEARDKQSNYLRLQ